MSESRLFLFVTAKDNIEEVLNDANTHLRTRRRLWTNIRTWLEALADPSARPSERAFGLQALRGYADGNGWLTAIETLQDASPVQRNAFAIWLERNCPSAPTDEVPGLGERNDSMSALTGSNEGETPSSVAAADHVMSAGVAAAAAAAEGGNHEGGRHQTAVAAAVGGVSEGGSEDEQTARNTLDYSTV
jgi:hypothetical protein